MMKFLIPLNSPEHKEFVKRMQYDGLIVKLLCDMNETIIIGVLTNEYGVPIVDTEYELLKEIGRF